MSQKFNTTRQLQLDINDPAKKLFFDGLPFIPLCSDDAKRFGLVHRPRELAALRRQIQYNPNTIARCLVFDIDKENMPDVYAWSAKYWWDDCSAPAPNWILINPHNGNCHYIYMLAVPVPLTDAARRKPMRYLSVIEELLADKLRADTGFTGLISKNPLSDYWIVETPREQSYSLDELAEYIPDNKEKKKRKKKREMTGLGRRMYIFDELRYWAYSRVLDARENMTFEGWMNKVLSRCEKLNTFSTPLAHAHIKSTAKSVAKWTWQHYVGSGSNVRRGRDAAQNFQLELHDKQVLAAYKTNQQRRTDTERKLLACAENLKAQGKLISKKSLAKNSGCSINTVRKYWDRISELGGGSVRCTSDNYQT